MIAPYNFERMFDDLWKTPMTTYTLSTGNSEHYHQTSTEDAFLIEMPMVGITKENLTVHIEDNVLTVKGKAEGKSSYVRNVTQSWTLRKECDVENISAVLENGLLTVKIPKIKPAKKTVSIKVN